MTTAVPEYVTVAEAADALRVTRRHVEKMIGRRQLPAVRLGGCVRVPVDALRPEALPPHTPEPVCPPPSNP